MAYRRLDFEKTLADPRSVYDRPAEVVADPRLDRRSKLQVLRSWEQDERALEVAEDEAMAGGEDSMLKRILDAIAYLQGYPPSERPTPTKQGGLSHESGSNDH